MNFDLSDEQKMLGEQARGLLTAMEPGFRVLADLSQLEARRRCHGSPTDEGWLNSHKGTKSDMGFWPSRSMPMDQICMPLSSRTRPGTGVIDNRLRRAV